MPFCKIEHLKARKTYGVPCVEVERLYREKKVRKEPERLPGKSMGIKLNRREYIKASYLERQTKSPPGARLYPLQSYPIITVLLVS